MFQVYARIVILYAFNLPVINVIWFRVIVFIVHVKFRSRIQLYLSGELCQYMPEGEGKKKKKKNKKKKKI